MFWRESERASSRDENGGSPLVGQVRVLVVGDSGVGKTSLVHLILNGSATARPSPTIGCSVSVKYITCGNPGSYSSNSVNNDKERGFFVELWDVSGHDRYKDCRSLFFSQINGVIFVYDQSQRRTKTSLQKWINEVASQGTFTAPLGSIGPYGLPVPYIVIGNKADVASKDGERGSSGSLVDVARQWVEKQGLLSSSEDLPMAETFPGNSVLAAAAREARFDKEAISKFFRMLIRRRYYADESPSPSPWSGMPRKPAQHSPEIVSEDDLYEPSSSLSSRSYSYNAQHPPLPAQRTLPPPPTLYPQDPVRVLDRAYGQSRYHGTVSDMSYSSTKLKRDDLNV